MKDFVNRVYSRLNPVIINWVDYYASLGQIDGYELTRYKAKSYISIDNTYKVIIDLVNDYRIDIDVSIPLNITCRVLSVRFLKRELNSEYGMFYSEPTLKRFNSWSYGGKLMEPNIRIGNDNADGYVERLDEKLAKIIS